jgi:pantoate--beta-alanine ligase
VFICHNPSQLPSLNGVIGFVPTMGALHEGHISLVKMAKSQCDHVVVSIFVNPTQFGKNEDFSRYPRPLEQDKALLEKEGVDVLFLPDSDAIYPEGTQNATTIHVPQLGKQLCGKSRPGHFDGVTGVVSRLFGSVRPHKAFFGEKDFQQLAIIKKMTRDLFLNVEVIGCPIVREPDGLAMSSRNRYLTPTERAAAPQLFKVLNRFRSLSQEHPTKTIPWLKKEALKPLLETSSLSLDYFKIHDENTLTPCRTINLHSRAFIAAYLGKTRLIDNIAIL